MKPETIEREVGMPENLSATELLELVRRTFRPRESDRALGILVDLPDETSPDTPAWRARRRMARDWAGLLLEKRAEHRMEVALYLYRNVHRNNADLPSIAWRYTAGELPGAADELDPRTAIPFSTVFSECSLIIAPTELSTTAPLKLNARRYGFRAATLPGFSPSMIPALRLDYREIHRRVQLLKELLDASASAALTFTVDGGATHRLLLDLRHRTAHASGGLITEPGTAGNLPSGEAYIVPYEGEVMGDATRSAGNLPVELDGEVVVYRIAGNRAVEVLSAGAVSSREANLLAEEPAYGNLAELGLGVLSGFGIQPVGEILLDEKLGLHIAFGRSDHFGGEVGAEDFSHPQAVVHQDRIYIPQLQPRVHVDRVDLEDDRGRRTTLMRDGEYQIDLGAGREERPKRSAE